ncbi:hypothetical protein NA57DRAFT_57754 [Rhizodiscina lignyota]|uniref:Uncharacterized protein n=1 Tax=Rhizodiscina lignyota TaxID=1504668 RepID=A0A9P4IAK4_9PEZI|nr:hypothetical protein NA57DRAFT_57754 [Rhizodiscina lignyota]
MDTARFQIHPISVTATPEVIRLPRSPSTQKASSEVPSPNQSLKMVALLDNKLVKLELVPGTREFQEAKRIAQYQGMDAAEEYAKEAKGQAHRALAGVPRPAAPEQAESTDETLNVTSSENLTEENQEKGEGEDGKKQTALQTVGNAGTGVLTTVGGTVKGVGDTLGNTVYSLGSGLTGTVVNTGVGLADAAQGKPPNMKAAGQEPAQSPADPNPVPNPVQ